MATLAGCIKRAGKALSNTDAAGIQSIRDEYVDMEMAADVAADQAVRDYVDILHQEKAALIEQIRAKGGDVSTLTGEIHFAAAPGVIETPAVEETDVPVLPIGRVEREIRDAFRRAKKAGATLTSRRLGAIFGSPKPRKGKDELDKNVKPTSWDQLKEMIEWSMDNVRGDGAWYDQFGKGIERIVGKANMFEASMLFGITSQQNAAETNLADTLFIMRLARRIDPVANPKRFENALRTETRTSPVTGKPVRLKITGPQIEKIAQMYSTGSLLYESDAGLKITNYMNTVRLRADNAWVPYSVQDVHMARVFGFRYRDVDKKSGNVLDASKFNNPNQIRYAQYLTAALAAEYGIQPYEAQALLWFYAKQNLSPKEADLSEKAMVGKGTWESARAYVENEVNEIEQMQEAGDWQVSQPFNEQLSGATEARFQQQTISDPYNNFELNEKLLEVARSRAPKVIVSFNPGNGKGYGFPTDTSFDYLRGYHESVRNAILNENGQIQMLADLGIPHEVSDTVGTFDRMEPGLTITLLGGNLDTANLVAPILGEAFLQDAVITSQPRWGGQQFGVAIHKRDGTTFEQAELAAVYDQVNPSRDPAGLNFTASADGKSLKFIDNVYYDKMFTEGAEPYGESDLRTFYEQVAQATGDNYALDIFAQEGEYFDESPSQGDRQRVWDRGAAQGSPDLQGVARDTLYEPVWETYRASVQELGYTPTNLQPPVEGLEPVPAQPARQHRIRYSAPEGRLDNARQDPEGPEAIYHKTGATVETQAQTGAPVGVKDWLAQAGDVAAKQKRHILNLVGRRNYGDFIESDRMPTLARWNRTANRMEGQRNMLLQAPAELGKRWNKWASKFKDQARILGELMYMSTLQQVDPSKPYAPLKARQNMTDLDRRIDAKRRADWEILNGFYEELHEDGKALYNEIRDMYVERRQQAEQGLMDRIDKSNASEEAKRETRDMLRQRFEQGRIEPYFPLMRFGNYWAVAKDKETGEVVSFTKFERQSRRNQWIREMKAEGLEAYGGEDSQAFSKDQAQQVDPAFAEKVVGLVENSPDPDTRALANDVWQMYLQSLPEMSMRKQNIKRQNRLGFTADMQRSFANYMYHSAQQISRLNHVAELEDQMRQIQLEAQELAKDLDAQGKDNEWAMPVADQAKWAHDWMMNPQTSRMATVLTTMGFGWYLAWTPAAAALNLMQTGLVGIPVLGGRFNMVGATVELNKALLQMTKARGDLQNYDQLRGDEQWAMRQAYDIGLITQTQTQALTGMAEEGQTYNENTKKFVEMGQWLFHNAEVVNRSITFLAAYRLAKKKLGDRFPQDKVDALMARKGDMTEEAFTNEMNELLEPLVHEAEDLTWDTHFDYSSSGRPRITRGNVGRVIFLFRQFSMNMGNLLVRRFNDGYLRPIYRTLRYKKDDPRRQFDIEHTKEMAQSFAGMLGMSAVVGSGITGLPLASTLKPVLNALLDPDKDDDEPYDAEAALFKHLRDQYGDRFAVFVMKGGFDAVTGWTMSSRVSLSNLFWRDARPTDTPGEKWDHYIEQFLGPVLGIGYNGAMGIHYLTEPSMPGTQNRGWERMMPKIISDQLKAIRYQQEGVTTRRGDVVVGRDEMDWWDLLGQGLGFSPEIVNRGYAQGRSVGEIARSLSERKRYVMTGLGMAYLAKDQREIQVWLERVREWNRNNPNDIIGSDNIRQSAYSRLRYSSETFRGVRIDPKYRHLIEQYDFTSTEGEEGEEQ